MSDVSLYPPDADRRLGFDTLRERLLGHARTPYGRDRLDSLAPSADLDLVRGRLATARFAVRVGGRVRFVEAAAVTRVEAAGDYVVLHADDGAHLLRATMGAVAARLPAGFVRVHRSTIVRGSAVRELRPDG